MTRSLVSGRAMTALSKLRVEIDPRAARPLNLAGAVGGIERGLAAVGIRAGGEKLLFLLAPPGDLGRLDPVHELCRGLRLVAGVDRPGQRRFLDLAGVEVERD